MTQESFWAVIAILVTIIVAMVGGIMSVRNEIAKRSHQKWERALAFAKIISAEDTPQLVREVAQLALYDVGIEIRAFEERAKHPSIRRLDPVVDSFDVPPSREQANQLTSAILNLDSIQPFSSDPDIKAFVAAGAFLKQKMLTVETAFEASRRAGHLDDDTRIRIAFILITMAAAYSMLLFGAIRAAIF